MARGWRLRFHVELAIRFAILALKSGNDISMAYINIVICFLSIDILVFEIGGRRADGWPNGKQLPSPFNTRNGGYGIVKNQLDEVL